MHATTEKQDRECMQNLLQPVVHRQLQCPLTDEGGNASRDVETEVEASQHPSWGPEASGKAAFWLQLLLMRLRVQQRMTCSSGSV
jgi:hypothetical protein